MSIIDFGVNYDGYASDVTVTFAKGTLTEEQEKQISALKGEFQKIEWGSQIRSYVLHPYQMVKDHRTDYEEGNTQAVLDGEIDGFIQTYLKAVKK